MRNQWIYKYSVQLKMTIAFLTLCILSVTVMALFSHNYYSRAVQKDFTMISKEATTRLNYHMEFYFKQMAKSLSTLITDAEIQKFLVDNRPYSPSEKQGIEKKLQSYFSLNYSEIQVMFLVSKDNQVISLYDYANGAEQIIKEQPWYSLPNQDTLQVVQTHLLKQSSSSGFPVISLIVPIIGIDGMTNIGKLVVELQLSEIDRTFNKSTLGTSGEFFIVSSDDVIVYHPNQDWLGLPREQTSLASIDLNQNEEVTIQNWQDKKMLVSSSQSSITNWKIFSFVPFEEMAGGLNAARNSTVYALMVILMLIILLVPKLSHHFVEPIVQLGKLMQKVSKGDFQTKALAAPGRDEVQQLNRNFNKMVTQLDDLVTTVKDLSLKEAHIRLQQKDAFIQALQNQINPHLLYNTLDIMKSIAYLEEAPLLEKMALNLGEIYRYTANIQGVEVTLKDELNHLTKYLEITHIRFPDSFESKLYVNEKFLDCKIVKLSLQPIVENAVKYAIERQGGDGGIFVSAYDVEEDLMIEIADNGPGIPEERLLRLQETLSRITANVQNEYVKEQSLGLSNVHARLVLHYGERYGLRIHSFAGKGTVVSVLIPRR
jgi:two-component system sensor histidine kinase YesM